MENNEEINKEELTNEEKIKRLVKIIKEVDKNIENKGKSIK